jgi:transposase-like protein
MNLIEFVKHYPDEKSCKELVKKYRLKDGIICRKCGNTEHYYNTGVDAFDCKSCGSRTTLKSGTVMESSKLPYQYWIYSIFLLTMTKKGISALELQRQLGHKRYEPIWRMLHKIRAVMGQRDRKYSLDGMVEMDDAFYKTHNDVYKVEQLQRGRGSEAQSKVLVMSQIEPKRGRPKKHRKPSAFRYVRMVVIPDSSSETMNVHTEDKLMPESTVKTDGWRGFNRITEVINKHISHIVPPQDSSKVLPWVHTMISNTKRNLLGIHHNIKDVYLQNYLDEFCYKVNRRYYGTKLFERLMVAAVDNTWYGKFSYE